MGADEGIRPRGGKLHDANGDGLRGGEPRRLDAQQVGAFVGGDQTGYPMRYRFGVGRPLQPRTERQT
jgi:hypothetical protein